MGWVVAYGAMAVALVLARGFGVTTAVYAGFLACLVAIAREDWHTRTVPNGWLGAAVLLRLVPLLGLLASTGDAATVGYALCEAAIGTVAVMAFIGGTAILASTAMGSCALGVGDIKLFGVAGWYFGWQGAVAVLLAASLLSLPLAAVQRARDHRAGRAFDGTFPFAPAIAVACWLEMLFG
jgi:leader peptidase (prepilin peptidase)/N-methyltransferase